MPKKTVRYRSGRECQRTASSSPASSGNPLLPARSVLDLVKVLTVLFGLVLAGYLIFIEKSVGKSEQQIPGFARNEKTDNGERIRERGGSSG